MNVSQTVHTSCEHIEGVHVGFDGARINCDRITAFQTTAFKLSHSGSFSDSFLHYGVYSKASRDFEGFFLYFVNILGT